MSVPIRAIALVFGQVVVVGAFVAASLGGQPNQRGKDISEEVRERALQTRRDSPLEAPLAIIICFLPSAHPESKLVIRFKSRTDVRVESVRASVESSEAIRKLRGAGPVDIAAAVALMRVNRRELSGPRVGQSLAHRFSHDCFALPRSNRQKRLRRDCAIGRHAVPAAVHGGRS
jgi:hypothetical protein